LNRRGPLHPAWLTPLRSLFAARSALFALLESAGSPAPRLAHAAAPWAP